MYTKYVKYLLLMPSTFQPIQILEQTMSITLALSYLSIVLHSPFLSTTCIYTQANTTAIQCKAMYANSQITRCGNTMSFVWAKRMYALPTNSPSLSHSHTRTHAHIQLSQFTSDDCQTEAFCQLNETIGNYVLTFSHLRSILPCSRCACCCSRGCFDASRTLIIVPYGLAMMLSARSIYKPGRWKIVLAAAIPRSSSPPHPNNRNANNALE